MSDPVTDTSEYDTEDDMTAIDARIAEASDIDPDAPLTDETPTDELVAVEAGATPIEEPVGMVAGDDHIAGDSPEGEPS